MSSAVDLVILFLFSAGLLTYEHFIGWPKTRAELASGRPGVRLAVYQKIILLQWTFVAIVLVRWQRGGLPLSALGLAMPPGWRVAALSVVLIIVTAVVFSAQSRSIARIPDAQIGAVRERLAPGIGDAILILPRTVHERRWFGALSITAGICEEFLFRGYAVWVMRPWLGLAGAAAASVLLFGLAHSYQGRRGAVRATMVGAVLGSLVLIIGSVIPAMLMHAIVDLGGGATGYALLGDHRGQPAEPARAGAAMALS